MKKIISLAAISVLLFTASCLLVMGGYLAFEPEIITAAESATTTTVTLNVTEEITLTPPADITMSPNISATENSSIGGTSTSPWLVKTNAAGGYELTLHASTTPALKDGVKTFADATTTSPVTWGFTAGQSCHGTTTCFGFSVFGGEEVATSTWGTGNNCGSDGTPNTTLKYLGFQSATSTVVATSNGGTPITGTGITMCVAAAQDTNYALSGSYSAIITGTATTQ